MNTWQNLKQACFAAGMSAITLAAAQTAAKLTEKEPAPAAEIHIANSEKA